MDNGMETIFLCDVFGEEAATARTCQRFGEFSLKDEPRSGRPSYVSDGSAAQNDQYISEFKKNRTVTCMVFKATANDRRTSKSSTSLRLWQRFIFRKQQQQHRGCIHKSLDRLIVQRPLYGGFSEARTHDTPATSS
ncbi:hypothetical protein TNCV_3260161 [Trichonephila clavipes]|nr:hypothetical protein TNCV_3260161 [Trichonephila clavipes]